MIKYLLVTLTLLICQVLEAQPEVIPPPAGKIKILSWNIYMLPHFVAASSNKKERAEAIGKALGLSDYDVVFFQEAFHPLARRRILAQMQKSFPYSSGPANRKQVSLKTNSGLWVFSKYPIVASRAIRFKTRYGVDALSRKGALLVELEVHGERIQVAGTHLQNCGPKKLKQLQCIEFFDGLLKPLGREGVPQVICGDFNIDRYTMESDYQCMLDNLDARDSNPSHLQYTYDRLNNDLRNETGDRKDLIDYILIRSNGSVVKASNSVVRMKGLYNFKIADLSDHYSLQAEVSFSSAGIPSASIK